jgi:SAM-dependent methyltransferase
MSRHPSSLALLQAHLDFLACPQCHGDIAFRDSQLFCSECQTAFSLVDGIPLMHAAYGSSSTTAQTMEAWNTAWQKAPDIAIADIEADQAYADALQHIRDHAPQRPWRIFLELGCGDARKSLVLAHEKPLLVVGVDASLAACQRAQALFAKYGKQGFFLVGDLRRMPLKAQKIDYIYAGGSMEHFPETAMAVKEAYRVLAPGGRITATVPYLSLASLTYAQLWGNIPELPVLRPILEWVHLKLLKGRHLRFGYEKSFSLRRWRRFFQEAGFASVHAGPFHTYMAFQFLPYFWMKCLARWLVRFRFFWPVIYADADR